jgi:hypothetical protein
MWSDKMRHHLTSLHASIWDIVEFGAQVPSVGDEGYDSDEVAQIRHFNSQATTILLASLCREEYNKLQRLKSTKKIWDVLKTAHEGDEVTKITKRETVEGELGQFVLNQGEEPQAMYNQLKTLKGFLRQAQNEFGLRIKKIRSDNGMEFKNSQIEGILEDEGIKHEFSSPNTPQQNGVVERKNRTLLDMARTMLDEYRTLDRFWAEAINIACYSINRLYLHRILKKTSYELLTGKKPNVSYFRVFGSKCFILTKRGRKSKFAPKDVEGFLLGYDSNTRAYRVFNKSTGLVEVSYDIVFDETNGSHVEKVDLDEQ